MSSIVQKVLTDIMFMGLLRARPGTMAQVRPRPADVLMPGERVQITLALGSDFFYLINLALRRLSGQFAPGRVAIRIPLMCVGNIWQWHKDARQVRIGEQSSRCGNRLPMTFASRRRVPFAGKLVAGGRA